MSVQEILHQIDHRQWDIPEGNWKYYQEWNKTIFLHWKADYSILRELVPKELEIDLYDGQAWVSVVAFTMEKTRPRNIPAFSPISNFHELNIRTYIKHKGKTGVYFLSIEGGKSISCSIARILSKMPYRYSEIKRTENTYTSTNSEFNDTFQIEYSIGNSITDKSELDKWLTERYALIQDAENNFYEFELHHAEWELNSIEIVNLKIDYPRFRQLFNSKPEFSHYSDGVKVIAWDKKKIKLQEF